MIQNRLTENNPQRKAFWLANEEGGQTFSWLHWPLAEVVNSVGIIIVGPIGPEYMHSHRSVRFLADELSQRGFASLRYDPPGMGNSSGSLDDNNIIAQWNASLVASKDFFNHTLGISQLVVVSLRSGSLVASKFLATQKLTGAVFWYPYLKGAAFVRDMQIIDSMLHLPAENPDFIEGGGYPLHPGPQEYLASIDLLKSNPFELSKALIVNNASQPVTKKLHQFLTAAGVNTDQENLSGLERMMKQAEITLVPEDNVSVIVNWLSQSFPATQVKNDNFPCPAQMEQKLYRETALTIPAARPLFGVLTEPGQTTNNNKAKPLVIFVNGGAGHHVGPNRLYTDICRRLATEGFASLRLDLNNLGDSANAITSESHNPYAETAAGDIHDAVEQMRKQAWNNFILVGLCSGAHNSFHAALLMQSAMVREIILINPLAFHWKQGDSLLAPEDSQHEADTTHYQNNMRSMSKWISLFTDPKKLRNAGVFALRMVRKKTARVTKVIAGRLGFTQLTRLEQDILAINKAGTHISLFIGETEPGYRLLLAQAGDTVMRQVEKDEMLISIIKDGDHTFSSFASRKNLIELFVTRLGKYQ